MKCLCCHKEIEGDVGRCPYCRCKIDRPLGGYEKASEEEMEMIRSRAASYRIARLTDVHVSINAHTWKNTGNGMEATGHPVYSLPACNELEFGKPVWINGKFARNISRESVALSVCVRSGDRNTETTVTLPRPQSEALWEVGAELREGLKLRFLLRCGSEIVCATDDLELL